MSALHLIQEPDMHGINKIPPPTSPVPPKTPKSMLKNLFTWRKVSSYNNNNNNTSIRSDASTDIRPQTAISKHEGQTITEKPSLSSRSRSDISVPQRAKTRSKSRRRSRSRCRAVWDPPPLFQAYSQAFMHDTLQVPSKGLLDCFIPRTTSSRSSAKNSDSIEEGRDEVESPSTRHRRSLSDSSATSLSKKLFFLFENGHLLQYKAEGSQDRLPERVLELSRESVAFASDAIHGQHYVLEICPYGRAGDEPTASGSRSTWSRMTLKAPDTKKLAEKLLLVFDNPTALFAWLIAIRKQIEGLGGIEYQPDAPPLPLPDPKRPTLRHASSEYFKRKECGTSSSRSIPAMGSKLDDSSASEKELPQLPAGLSDQGSVSARSVTASSIVTNTSLERLRESYSGSSTAGTTLSSNMSAKSLSPTRDTFLPMLSPVLARDSRSRIAMDRSLPKSPSSPLHRSEEQSPSPDALPCGHDSSLIVASERTVGEVDMEQNSGAMSMPQIPQVVIPPDASFPAIKYPTLVLDAAPTPELRKTLRQAQRKLSIPNPDTNAEPDAQAQVDADCSSATRSSPATSSKGSYGLFPKKLALNVKTEPLVLPEQNHMPGLSHTQATDHLEISATPITPVAASFGEVLFSRSNTTFKRPAAITLPSLLAVPLELDQPMRSPAVTAAMLDSNFGTGLNDAVTQPTTPVKIQVPSFSDVGINERFFDSFREAEAEIDSRLSPSPSIKSRGLKTRRSMPNFRYGSANMISAPVAPPPSVPLPAVPSIANGDGQSSRSATPNKRMSAQSSGNRRASMKSVSSVKKVRSPAPSFSMPQPQSRVSLPSIVKSTASLEGQDRPPCSSSNPLPNLRVPAATIGQVSIISAPPHPPSLSRHKKSPSASSLKSHRSRNMHNRTPSSRSVHSSITNLPQVTHLIKPPCGFESDFDLTNKSCFGINNSRSSTAQLTRFDT